MDTAGRIFLVAALVCAVLGGAFLLLGKLGVNELPGTFVYRRGALTVFAPIGLMILLSVVLTIVLNLRR